VREREGGDGWQRSAIQSIAAKIGCSGETLRNWVRQSERDRDVRPGQTTDERERIRALEREVRELRQADEILREASVVCAIAELGRRSRPMIAFIDEHREVYGVEPICRVLPIAPSTNSAHAARRADPKTQPARARSDTALMTKIQGATAPPPRRWSVAR
jgi:transposase